MEEIYLSHTRRLIISRVVTSLQSVAGRPQEVGSNSDKTIHVIGVIPKRRPREGKNWLQVYKNGGI